MNRIVKIVMGGRSQVVRLLKGFKLNCDKVFVKKQGSDAVISPKITTWDDFFDQTPAFDDSFMSDREDSEPQERDFY